MSGYIGATPVPQATQHREAFTATASQTSFATAGYTPQFLDVYLNGVKLAAADYTATNGSDIVLTTGAALDDILEYVAYTPFEVADQTFTGTTTVTDSGAAPLVANRTTSDGAITVFQKDGSTVGSIGAYANEYYHGSAVGGDTFLRHGYGGIVPATSSGTNRDAAIQLGSSVSRFKDLYLSGGVYLGGTGAANKLDDYEEGTWTPVLVGASGTPSYTLVNARGYYVKVGKKVHVSMDWYATSVSGGSGDAYFTGLPFLQDSSQIGPTGPARLYQVGGYNPAVAIYGYSALALFVSQGPTNSVWRWGTVGDIQGTSIISASIDYLAA